MTWRIARLAARQTAGWPDARSKGIGYAGIALALSGCSGASSVETGASRDRVVYGEDDRREPFETAPTWWTGVLPSRLLALGNDDQVVSEPPAVVILASTLEERDGVCHDELFAEQPAFAFCSAFLVSSRYALTAGHCIRALPLEQIVAIGGFTYDAPGALRPLTIADRYAFSRVVVRDDFWDYAWLELSRPVVGLQQVIVGHIVAGDAIVCVQHGAGIPAKVASSVVARASGETFFSTLDSFGGASGSPVFTEFGALVGILTSGARDYEMTPSGCLRASVRIDTPEDAAERALKIDFALDGLCEVTNDSELCPLSNTLRGSTNCSMQRGVGLIRNNTPPTGLLLLAGILIWIGRLRARKTAGFTGVRRTRKS